MLSVNMCPLSIRKTYSSNNLVACYRHIHVYIIVFTTMYKFTFPLLEIFGVLVNKHFELTEILIYITYGTCTNLSCELLPSCMYWV